MKARFSRSSLTCSVNEYFLTVFTYSATWQQVRQLGDVDGDPPRLVAISDTGRL
jgi:hypothetical protein